MENNEKIIELQKYMGELQILVGEKKRQEVIRQREKEEAEMEKWVEEYRRRNEKEREEEDR